MNGDPRPISPADASLQTSDPFTFSAGFIIF